MKKVKALQERQALGRLKGGFSTRIYVLMETSGKPIK